MNLIKITVSDSGSNFCCLIEGYCKCAALLGCLKSRLCHLRSYKNQVMVNKINALLSRPTPVPSLRRKRTPHGGELLINTLMNLKLLDFTFRQVTRLYSDDLLCEVVASKNPI